MAVTYMSSMVFVVGQFPVEMFDERALFGGRLDHGGQMKAGPIGQFSYAGGSYQFLVTPNRIDLKCVGPHIMPSALVNAVRMVADVIEPHVESDGEHLFVAVNAHQVVDRGEPLDSKFGLAQIKAFSAYVQGLHQRVTDDLRSA